MIKNAIGIFLLGGILLCPLKGYTVADRTFIILLNTDGNFYSSLARRDEAGNISVEQVFTPDRHFDIILNAALQAGDRFNTILSYDPLGSSGLTNYWHSERSSRVMVISGGEILYEDWSRESSSVHPEALVELFGLAHEYFGYAPDVSMFRLARDPMEKYQPGTTRLSPEDRSEPDIPFFLGELREQLEEARHEYPGFFPLNSISFLGCRGAGIELFSQFPHYLTTYILANELPVSNLAWFASFEFLNEITASNSIEEVLSNVIDVNTRNGQTNLATEREVPFDSRWIYVHTTRIRHLYEQLHLVFHYLDTRFIRANRCAQLRNIFEASRIQSEFDEGGTEGLDLGEFLRQLSEEADAPEAVFEAWRLYQETVQGGAPLLTGQTGMWMVSDPAYGTDYASLDFNRRTGWYRLVLQPYLQWLDDHWYLNQK